ncbi:ParB N-terminal domain-containing protein [Streptomyces sp. DH12]|uniref:ParB/RepB/Spo0J family partition protein n=1 Tax=Streptomyces sp. DH12 TaxID=2857010 RepID=UPI001E5DD8CB|nr:ParB N-terminal domain-containing protein [Streptomyces sp. DH12]
MTLHPALPPDRIAENPLLDAPDRLRDLPCEIVSIDELMPSLAPREQREDPSHVRLLAETGGTCDPLLVHRATMRVIDGAHRLRAAVMRGRTAVEVQFFDGSEEDAFVLAVQLNVRHGLPLTLDERRAAAARVIRSHPHWSDRVVAQRTGLSPKTVGKVRARAGEYADGPARRVGGDGRVRPLSSVEGRRSAAVLLAEHPGMSLREVARRTGLAVGTVRDVRDRLNKGRDVVPDRLRGPEDRRGADTWPPAAAPPGGAPASGGASGGAAGGAPAPSVPRAGARPVAARPPADQAGRARGEARGAPFDPATAVRRLARDPALRATESGRQLLRMLLATELAQPRWEEIAEAVPAHCVPLVREVLLRRCEDLRKLADSVPGGPDFPR